MYLAESGIVEPPAEGWPSLTTNLQDLGKTDEVLSLLAHLPYIREAGDDNYHTHAVPWSRFADWRDIGDSMSQGSSTGETIKILTEGLIYEDVPPHVIGLTFCPDKAVGPHFLLDTELGIVHWWECDGKIQERKSRDSVGDDAYRYAPENEAEWRAEGMSWAIVDFFEVLKDLFRDLHFVPTKSLKLVDDYTFLLGRDGMVPMLQNIYREHGWPNMEQYRKQECLEAIHRALEEKYPDWV